jgi:hypothetical protein
VTEGNRIPTRSREIVHTRERGRCLRCGGRGQEWAHRRRRNVADGHQHCPCNGCWLCNTCHQDWAHKNPIAAREEGFIVSQFQHLPGSVPVHSFYGVLYLECDGGIRFDVPTWEPEEEQHVVRRNDTDGGGARSI